jgi:hypothetical protein
MRRHPIHDHADPGLVTFVDKMAELIRRSEAAGGREVIRDLITPGALEGMLGHRHELDVGVAHLDYVRNERLGQFEITERPIAFVRLAPPRAEMHFVNTESAGMQLPGGARFHPVAIVPPVAVEVVNHRRSLDAVLTEEAKRIALQEQRAGRRPDLELVMDSFADPGEE